MSLCKAIIITTGACILVFFVGIGSLIVELQDGGMTVTTEKSGEIIKSVVPGLLPGIEEFLKYHTESKCMRCECGTPLSISLTPDWDKGKRQWVRTIKGNFLFYLLGEEVMLVCKEHPMNRIWQKD